MRTRQQALLYLVLAVVGMMILAAGLPDLEFKDGLPIPGAETAAPAAPASESGLSKSGAFFPWLLLGAAALGFILLLFALVTSIRKKAGVKRIGWVVAGLGILFVVLSWLLPDVPMQPAPAAGNSAYEQAPTFDYRIAPIGDPPAGLFWFVIAALLLAGAALSVWLLIKIFSTTEKEDPLAYEAGAALQAVTGGQCLSEVIIRCYLRMEQSIKEAHGIERDAAVTPREFEKYLTSRGIPRDPIRQLTRLFEKVRYSDQPTGPQDEQEAVNCLSAIRAACLAAQRGRR